MKLETIEKELKKFSNDDNSIPKIIHLFGLPSIDTLPPPFKKSHQKLIKALPDYKIMVWTKEEIEALNGDSKFFQGNIDVKKFAGAKDFFSIYILYKYGGFAFDGDVEVYKSLNPLLKNNLIYTNSKSMMQMPLVCMGSRPGNPIFLEFINATEKKYANGFKKSTSGGFFYYNSFFKFFLNSDLPLTNHDGGIGMDEEKRYLKHFFSYSGKNSNNLGDDSLVEGRGYKETYKVENMGKEGALHLYSIGVRLGFIEVLHHHKYLKDYKKIPLKGRFLSGTLHIAKAPFMPLFYAGKIFKYFRFE